MDIITSRAAPSHEPIVNNLRRVAQSASHGVCSTVWRCWNAKSCQHQQSPSLEYTCGQPWTQYGGMPAGIRSSAFVEPRFMKSSINVQLSSQKRARTVQS